MINWLKKKWYKIKYGEELTSDEIAELARYRRHTKIVADILRNIKWRGP